MYQEDQRLAEQCGKLSVNTIKACEWLDDNAEVVDRDLKGHKKALRKARRLFESCAVAAQRKMCVGVFGPSQVGKSYLVSTLAGDGNHKLLTTLDGVQRDFLLDINPQGGKESTGLVTRFTMEHTAPLQQGFPVHVRLLSVTDVAKIVANTYYSDARHTDEPDRAVFLQKLNELSSRAQAAPTGGVTEDDCEDMQDYIRQQFNDKVRVQQLLDQNFWDRAIALAPCLGDEDRAELFGLIWGEIPELTTIFLKLARQLRAFNFAAEAFCPTVALLPREESIIDVAALSGLTAAKAAPFEVQLPDGKRTMVPRGEIAALTAEMVIKMDAKPADFFDHTDLLDFPGYRSREVFTNMAEAVKDSEVLELCFLRGKVEYLFQRYCAERELTGLLLCVGPGVQEVKGLPGAVDAWVKGTHGETPETRTGKDCSLFFILSKSDLEFEDKAGAVDVSDRWDIRIGSSMKNFELHSQWPQRWDSKGPFHNLFFMRNTTIRFPLFEHDANGNEKNIAPSNVEYVEKFHKAFVGSQVVSTFCPCPQEMWERFMGLNDGGISLIRDRLVPICRPDLKRGQIETTVGETLGKLKVRLQPYWKTDNKEEEARQKELLGMGLAKKALQMAEKQRFGQFLRMLMLTDQDVYSLYFQAQYAIQDSAGNPGAAGAPVAGASPIGSRFSADSLFNDLFDEPPATSATEADKGTSEAKTKDEAQAFAEQIETFWLGKLQSLSEDTVVQEYFSFTREDFAQLVHELSVGFIRLGFRTTLEDALRQASQYSNQEVERIVWKQASLAVGIVNSYVDWLGFNPRTTPEAERTIAIRANSLTVFKQPAAFTGLPELGPEPLTYDGIYYRDWAAALVHLINNNVYFDGVQKFDPAQNNRLKGVIDAFTLG